MKTPLKASEGKSSTRTPTAQRTSEAPRTPAAQRTPEAPRTPTVQRTPAAPDTPTADAAPPAEVAKSFAGSSTSGDGRLPDHERRRRISEAAYYKSERRGFAPGAEEQDWFEAERELDDSDEGGKLRPEENTFPSPQ